MSSREHCGMSSRYLIAISNKITLQAYNWILKHREWSSKIDDMSFQVLSPNTDFSQHCSIVGICRGVVILQLFEIPTNNINALPNQTEKVYGVVFATYGNDEALKKCMSTTQLIPWLEFSHFTGVIERHALIMTQVLQEKGFKTTENEISPSYLLHIPIAKALEQKIPRF